MQTAAHHCLTHDEYFALEAETGEKYEYCRGEVFAVAGGTIEHAALQLTVANAVMNRLRGRPCKSSSSDLRVYIEAVDLYTYPDLSVVCGPPRSQGDHALLNPTLLVEVLSPSTEAYDRGEKFALYQQLESLQQYMLVSQDRHVSTAGPRGRPARFTPGGGVRDETELTSTLEASNLSVLFHRRCAMSEALKVPDEAENEDFDGLAEEDRAALHAALDETFRTPDDSVSGAVVMANLRKMSERYLSRKS